jgi:integrase
MFSMGYTPNSLLTFASSRYNPVQSVGASVGSNVGANMAAISSRKVETIKKKGRYAVGGGLYLAVSASGRKTWVMRYQMNGSRKDMGLGSYPVVGLADARHRSAEARRLMSQGLDPIIERHVARRAAKPIPTFAEVAELVIGDIDRKSASEKVRYRARLLLGESYCGPLLKQPVNTITSSDVARLLNAVRAEKPETARKLQGILSKLFETARVLLRDEHGVVLGDLPTNLKDLKALGFDPRVRNERYPALDWRQAQDFMAALRKHGGVSHRALEVAALTGLREGSVAIAEWSEIDLEAGIWTVPIENLKDKLTRTQTLRVPLSNRVMEIMRSLVGHSEQWVFPGTKPNKPIVAQSLLEALKKLNKDAKGELLWLDPESRKPIVVHGFRSTLRTWAEDHGFRREVAEQSLGHSIGSNIEARYRRTDILEERRVMLQAFDDYCSAAPADNVISLRKA